MSVRCQHCGRESGVISQALGVCLDCIRGDFAAVLPSIEETHKKARSLFNLPPHPPKSEVGPQCCICVNECRLPPNSRSFCGLRYNEGNKLKGATADKANVSWYYDPLPTNCVADWVCPGGTGAGYPDFAYRAGPEYGYKNLAVFYQACSFDCLFCQNWHYRSQALKEATVTASRLTDAVDGQTSCICYFGGDPTPQLPHSIRVARLALQKKRGRILRICWETNGSMHPALLRQAAEISLNSGGCIKFDLKAWNEEVHIALCGVSNKRTLGNFQLLAEYTKKRPSPPFLVASTLLVPGYIDKQEVSQIAQFISSLNPDIPYSLLAFAPQFMMRDLPTTSRRHAEECLAVAKARGLKKVRLGNIHLLGGDTVA
ncbi:MAG: radical SAM protein [Chloroflexi bacterium CG07_land_8_20_14_0_80_45_17]|nr:MAG: radical SAM protein [Chloroflexi bacterium CG07_land_8_20_14_0_80_45_17]